MHNNVLNSFSGISAVFPPKKCFYSDFGPSALQLRMGESAVILVLIMYVEKTCKSTPYRSKMTDVCREY